MKVWLVRCGVEDPYEGSPDVVDVCLTEAAAQRVMAEEAYRGPSLFIEEWEVTE